MKREKYFTLKVNRTETVHKGKIFQLIRENITIDGHITVDLDIIRHPGAAGIVPLSQESTVILIKQYRHAIGDFIFEIPAGLINPDETPLECAKRELIEETGFSANIWRPMGPIIPLPGYSDERVYMFLAAELIPIEQHTEIDEILDVQEINLEDAIQMIYKGEIQDSKTISGLFMANLWLKYR